MDEAGKNPLLVPDSLNHGCFCFRLEAGAIDRALEAEISDPALVNLLRERCPTVFSEQPVFVGAAQLRRMADVIAAIETVVALPAYQASVLKSAPDIARIGEVGPSGVFFGYDFHADGNVLGLIEINTNAGGAMPNALLARAERRSCPGLVSLVPSEESAQAFETAIVAMFRNEWRLAGRTTALERIAIVDQAPEAQYLYPEFLSSSACSSAPVSMPSLPTPPPSRGGRAGSGSASCRSTWSTTG